MKYKNIREEELKNKVSANWFKHFDGNYTLLISELRNQNNALADKIKAKIYE